MTMFRIYGVVDYGYKLVEADDEEGARKRIPKSRRGNITRVDEVRPSSYYQALKASKAGAQPAPKAVRKAG
jgi:hypothetical protein